MLKKIILASGSPRRKELLGLAGVQFTVVLPNVDETPLRNEKPEQMVKRLAFLKALEVSKSKGYQKGSHLILAADTTVVDPKGNNLGKPEHEKEAIQMLTQLQGRFHSVFTGYSIVLINEGKIIRKKKASVRTRVKIQKMDAHAVRRYVSKGESSDKAGAYAAQGFGMAIIEELRGSYTNVVGLPMTQVLKDLEKLGWKR